MSDRVDDDDDVTELGGDDAAPVVSVMFRPNDVDFVVAEVLQLQRNKVSPLTEKWYYFRLVCVGESNIQLSAASKRLVFMPKPRQHIRWKISLF